MLLFLYLNFLLWHVLNFVIFARTLGLVQVLDFLNRGKRGIVSPTVHKVNRNEKKKIKPVAPEPVQDYFRFLPLKTPGNSGSVSS
jgi:hypothetical protein